MHLLGSHPSWLRYVIGFHVSKNSSCCDRRTRIMRRAQAAVLQSIKAIF
jgi:hypothetical protein